MLGPVSNAAHSVPTIGGALFLVGGGLAVLVYAWVHFVRSGERQSKPPMGNMIGLTFICCTMIGIGIIEWIRAVEISN